MARPFSKWNWGRRKKPALSAHRVPCIDDATMVATPRLLYCHCAYAQVVPGAVKAAVLQTLCESGRSFAAVADLCELAARRDPALPRLAEGGAVKIAACYPRAVKWLFAAARAPLPGGSAEVLNLREQSPEAIGAALLSPELKPNLPAGQADGPAARSPSAPSEADPPLQPPPAPTTLRVALYEGPGAQPLPPGACLAAITALLEKGYAIEHLANDGSIAPAGRGPLLVLGCFAKGRPSVIASIPEPAGVRYQDIAGLDAARIVETVEAARVAAQAALPGEWKPWFPVIDYDRCTHCMQCLSFCLFGVFGVDARRRLEVQYAGNCKTNCPACSRVCPEVAIMFPKYKAGPINGEAVSEADLQREKMKIDVSALLGGDIYQVLRERSERARSRFSKERDATQALQERRKCLARLAQAADIPPEVLMALPAPEEIQRRAQEAAAKAQAALKTPPSPA